MCTLESRIDRGEGWIDRSRLKFLENPINEVSVTDVGGKLLKLSVAMDGLYKSFKL